jgi:hypothetical protein
MNPAAFLILPMVRQNQVNTLLRNVLTSARLQFGAVSPSEKSLDVVEKRGLRKGVGSLFTHDSLNLCSLIDSSPKVSQPVAFAMWITLFHSYPGQAP